MADGSSRKDSARKVVFYRPELDLLRFVAFLMVFAVHATPAVWIQSKLAESVHLACRGGVQTFFLLSAYLIGELLLQERDRSGTVQLSKFYIRRILRIWPLYYTALLLGLLLHRYTHFTARAFAEFALLSGNWFIYFHGWGGGLNLLGPLWSISIEEQFYLVFPVLAKYSAKWVIGGVCALAIVAANATLYILGQAHAAEFKAFTHTLVGFQFFALGTMLAIWLHRSAWSVPRFARPLLGALSALCFFRFGSLDASGSEALLLAYGSLSLGTVLIFLAIYRMEVPRSCAPLVYLGRISYGLYVFHYLAIAVVRGLYTHGHLHSSLASFILSLVLTIALAAGSYRFLEMPFLRLKRHFAVIQSGSASLAVEQQERNEAMVVSST